jgi:imidazole glycerol phosphate synthase glutamine amidotransferase subunit
LITILDYGAGNLRSVENTLAEVGAQFELTRDPRGVERADKLLLPGVGHFGQMMRALDALGVRDCLAAKIRDGVPFLGICLGLQALFAASEEAPGARGLGIFPGIVRRFKPGLRVPHMGWNDLSRIPDSRLLAGIGEEPFVYFANSYYAPVVPETCATCTYGVEFSAALEQGRLNAVQFHPEKSGPVGLRIMRNFAEL